MSVHRVARTQLDRQDAHVASYGLALRSIFTDWLAHSESAGVSTSSLAARLQAAAEAHYEAAFLIGKRQAYSRSALNDDDRTWIRRTLASNGRYLDQSLATDIEEKVSLQRLAGPDLRGLETIFAARIERQYGGQLWRVAEAGYASGVRDIQAALSSRFSVPIRQEEVDPEGDDAETETQTASVAELAALLGISIAVLLRALAGRQVSDLRNVFTSRPVADRLGVTRAALSDLARQAGERAAQGTADGALARALGISVDDLGRLGSGLNRGDFAIGTAYLAQNDGDTCIDCRDFASGGDGNGVYYLPDESPLPGSGRCGGNCRCSLAVYWASDLV